MNKINQHNLAVTVKRNGELPPALLDEYSGIVKSIKKYGFNFIIATYNDVTTRNSVIDRITSFHPTTSIIDATALKTPDIYDFEHQIHECAQNSSIEHIINIEYRPDADFTTFLRELNFHREHIAQLAPVNMVFWILEYRAKDFITVAPDLWSWNSGVFTFTIEKEPLPLETLPDNPEIAELNLTATRIRIKTLINHFSEISPDNISDGERLLLEELRKHLENIYTYKKTYDFIDEELRSLRDQSIALLNAYGKNINVSLSGRLPITATVYPLSVTVTPSCDTIINEIVKPDFSKDSLQIMQGFSILPSQEMPDTFLFELFGVQDDNRLEFENRIDGLIEWGWLNRMENGLLCQQEVRQCILSNAKPSFDDVRQVIMFISEQLNIQIHENPFEKIKWIQYAESILENITDKRNEVADLANRVALIFQSLCDFKKAFKFLTISINILEILPLKDSQSLAFSYNNLAMIYKDLGIFDKSLNSALKSIAIAEKIFPPDHPNLATAYNNIAMIYKGSGNLDKALYFAQRSITIFERISPDHPNLAASYSNIALIYKEYGDLDKSLEFTLKDIAIAEKIFSSDHPNLATSYHNLSSIYDDLGDLEKSIEYEKKAAAILDKNELNNHPHLMSSYRHLSSLYRSLCDDEKSREYAAKAHDANTDLFEK